jgi:hypothetical protein
MGLSSGHLRGLAPVGLGSDQVWFHHRVVVYARIRQRGDMHERSHTGDRLTFSRRSPCLRRRRRRGLWLATSASPAALSRGRQNVDSLSGVPPGGGFVPKRAPLSVLRADSMKEEQRRVLLDNSSHGGWPTFSAGPQQRGYYREMG